MIVRCLATANLSLVLPKASVLSGLDRSLWICDGRLTDPTQALW